MTWSKLLEYLDSKDVNRCYNLVCQFMAAVEDVTGTFPDWNSDVPHEYLEMCGINL